jgi:hypothetical protein
MLIKRTILCIILLLSVYTYVSAQEPCGQEDLYERLECIERKLEELEKRGLGDPERGYNFNTVYTAPSDGFVTVLGYDSQQNYVYIEGFTGPSQNSTTRVAAEIVGGEYYNDFGSFTFPVKRGAVWKVVTSKEGKSCPRCQIHWTPLK